MKQLLQVMENTEAASSSIQSKFIIYKVKVQIIVKGGAEQEEPSRRR